MLVSTIKVAIGCHSSIERALIRDGRLLRMAGGGLDHWSEQLLTHSREMEVTPFELRA